MPPKVLYFDLGMVLVLKQAYAVAVFWADFGEFRGAWRRGRTLWVGWWRFGLFVLQACELSGPGAVADRSVQAPASWVAR